MWRMAAIAVFTALTLISFLWGSVTEALAWLVVLVFVVLLSAVYELLLDIWKEFHNGR